MRSMRKKVDGNGKLSPLHPIAMILIASALASCAPAREPVTSGSSRPNETGLVNALNFTLADRHAVLEVERALLAGDVGDVRGVDIRLASLAGRASSKTRPSGLPIENREASFDKC